MVELNESLTRKVADLARLELSAEEVTTFTRQLGDILRYVDQLQAVDVSAIAPLYHPFEEAAQLRADEARPFASEKLLAQAPAAWDDAYQVPPIL